MIRLTAARADKSSLLSTAADGSVKGSSAGTSETDCANELIKMDLTVEEFPECTVKLNDNSDCGSSSKLKDDDASKRKK